MPLVEFAVLGPLEATRGGTPIVLGAGRQRALLALLLIHANEVERLIDELWGSDPPAGAAHSLQVYVSGLRKVPWKTRSRPNWRWAGPRGVANPHPVLPGPAQSL
jgi:DNA-binding SARP family transcriptional activator